MLGDTGPLGRLRMRVVYDWRGAAPRFADHTGVGLRARDYHRPVNPGEPWENLTTGEVVYQAIKLRSALAHRYLPRMGDPPSPAGNGAKPKPEASHWLNLPGQLFWLSDKNDGLSVQAGCARGVLALFIQLIDQVVVMLAGTLTEPENRAAVLRYRLPEEWFGQPTRPHAAEDSSKTCNCGGAKNCGASRSNTSGRPTHEGQSARYSRLQRF